MSIDVANESMSTVVSISVGISCGMEEAAGEGETSERDSPIAVVRVEALPFGLSGVTVVDGELKPGLDPSTMPSKTVGEFMLTEHIAIDLGMLATKLIFLRRKRA